MPADQFALFPDDAPSAPRRSKRDAAIASIAARGDPAAAAVHWTEMDYYDDPALVDERRAWMRRPRAFAAIRRCRTILDERPLAAPDPPPALHPDAARAAIKASSGRIARIHPLEGMRRPAAIHGAGLIAPGDRVVIARKCHRANEPHRRPYLDWRGKTATVVSTGPGGIAVEIDGREGALVVDACELIRPGVRP